MQLSSGSFVVLHLYRCSIVAKSKFVIKVITEICRLLKQDLEMHALTDALTDVDVMPFLIVYLFNHHHSSTVVAALLNLSIFSRETLMCTMSMFDALASSSPPPPSMPSYPFK
ncbi:hypothetical protein BHE74_00047969 [Ensete ventricosum]|nr:hypothetical protein BHE74_00047969 [Ensete ventricosum]RZS27223.1 hypothetical protein BHM03_00060652 [Ensete ventricosum]